MSNVAILDLSDADRDKQYQFGAAIAEATEAAQLRLEDIDEIIAAAQALRLECDRLDYVLAASSGALCGLIDVFFVGAPHESALRKSAKQWVPQCAIAFAQLCGWQSGQPNFASAAAFLIARFLGPSGINPEDIDFDSGGNPFRAYERHPSMFGLFASILAQFTADDADEPIPSNDDSGNRDNSKSHLHFATGSDGADALRGSTLAERCFCGIVNWLCAQLFGTVNLNAIAENTAFGLGIPSPLVDWIRNAVGARYRNGIPAPQFLAAFQRLVDSLVARGYDSGFLMAQSIPVAINEAVTRLLYATRRFIVYVNEHGLDLEDHSAIWEACDPFTNVTVKRMLTVAHATFCLLDTADAVTRGVMGGVVNAPEIIMRINVVGTGRFAISLYGEGKRAIRLYTVAPRAAFAACERTIVEDYLDGLDELARRYDDRKLIDFTDDFRSSGPYIAAFEKSAQLAALRDVPDDEILTTKSDIDSYFTSKE